MMFPKGSPELVEPIYKNPVLSAPFNEQLTAAIYAYTVNMLQVCLAYQLLSMKHSLHSMHPGLAPQKDCSCSHGHTDDVQGALATHVDFAVQGLPAGKKVRIIEVGSGSGGTSVVVMAALADLGDRVELTYTDLSPQLIAYGQKTYGPQYPFVVFKQLDVEKSVEDQVRVSERDRTGHRPAEVLSRLSLRCSAWPAHLKSLVIVCAVCRLM